MTKAAEHLDDNRTAKLAGLLAAGDPLRKRRVTWHAKETTREIYDLTDPALAEEYVCELATDMQDQSHPPQVRSLGRTLATWFDEVTNWHKASSPTGRLKRPTTRSNGLASASGRSRIYRIRVLLYAGQSNWDHLATVSPL